MTALLRTSSTAVWRNLVHHRSCQDSALEFLGCSLARYSSLVSGFASLRSTSNVIDSPHCREHPYRSACLDFQYTRIRCELRGLHSSKPVSEDVASTSSSNGSIAASDTEEINDPLQQRLLSTALKFVLREGWSVQALQSAAQELGISPSAAGIVQQGPIELVQYFVRTSNQEFFRQLHEKHAAWTPEVSASERIFQALKMRLEMNIPYIDTWAQALALQARPEAIASSLQLLGSLVDEIWHTTGDVSVDYSWYVKRGVLAGVYCATELYMLTDLSPGFSDTWESLQRRVEDILKAERMSQQVSSQAATLLQSFGPLVASIIKEMPKPK